MEEKQEGKPEERICPFLKENCIKERCTLYVDMKRMQERFGACALTALVMINSEMNAKMQSPQQMIKIPPLYKG